MTPPFTAVVMLIAGISAQAQDARTSTENQSVLAVLQRVEQAQKALIVLQRIQIDEGRKVALEARRLQLVALEADWSKRGATSPPAPTAAGALPTLVSLKADGTPEVVRTVPAAPSAEDSRSLNDIRRERQETEASIAVLKKKIADWEKRFEALLQAGVLPD